MTDFQEKIKQANCCSCGRLMGQSKALNLVALNKVAGWSYPVAGHIEADVPDQAIAVVCDSCVHKGALPSWAIEFAGDEIKYHAVDELQTLEQLFPVPLIDSNGGFLCPHCQGRLLVPAGCEFMPGIGRCRSCHKLFQVTEEWIHQVNEIIAREKIHG